MAIGILPVALFASGHTYFVQRLHERMGLEVYCVHATFQYSGTTGKRHRMRERQLWVVVSHSSFSSPLLPLSVLPKDPDVPGSDLRARHLPVLWHLNIWVRPGSP